MSQNTTAALKVRHLRCCLINEIKKGVKFQVSKRGRLYFREDKIFIDLNQDYDNQTEIYVGEKVMVHSQLEQPWSVSESDSADLVGPYYVVAFATSVAYINNQTNFNFKGSFCILTKDINFNHLNSTPFLMAEDKIALFFANALEVVE